jgi:tRNA nucleotidyltransferase/poly(A) polymerase
MRIALGRAMRRQPGLRRLLREIASAVDGAGGAAYLVGGYLRDIAEGRRSGDVDLLVTGISHRRTGALLRSLGRATPGIRKVLSVGRHFPVHRLAVAWGKGYIDVSNARSDRDFPGVRKVKGTDRNDISAVLDAARRDFTMNSLLYRLDPESGAEGGRLIDPFGGMEDLRRKRIRCVGNAADRFGEDPLRILRAIRLKNERPGFVLHPSTESAIRSRARRLLPAVSPDRISGELVRSLVADPVESVIDLSRLGLVRILLPEFGRNAGKYAGRIVRRFRFLARSIREPLPVTLLLANLLADLPPPAAVAAARRLHLPDPRGIGSELRRLDTLAHPEKLRYPRAETESALLGSKDPVQSIALCRAVQRTGNRKARNLKSFLKLCQTTPWLIDGFLLKEKGIPEGPVRREIVLRVREETLAGRIRRKSEAETLVGSLRGTSGGATRFPSRRRTSLGERL